ncbi:MAG: tyrosine-type recombinase/integrase [Elusimicrobiota bacterium]
MSDDFTLAQLKEYYLQHLQLKGFSAFTVRQTEQMVRIFLNFLKANGITEIKKVNLENLEDYKGHLTRYKTKKENNLTPSTILTRLMAVRNFFRYLLKKGLIYRDITEGWQMPKDRRPLPRGIMTIQEINKIMKQPQIRTTLGYRDRTILEVLYSTGIRAGELIRLKVSDVDLDKKVLRVNKGKGGKSRYVLLNTPTCRFLERYLKKIRPELAKCPRPSGNNWEQKSKTGEGILFITVYGGLISQGWIDTMIKKYLKLAGITKQVAPCHSFRHSVATHLLESGMDVRYVQAFLGHETIQTTQIYTHIEKEKLRELLKKYYPREKNRVQVKIFSDEIKIPKGNKDKYNYATV